MGAQGTATLDFGTFPGASDASVDAASAGVVAGSLVEAWIRPVATADHSVDEHMVETLKVVGRYLSDGNLRIHGFNTNQVTPLLDPGTGERSVAPRIYGQWNVGWVWN